jgi:hypothetical protein
VERPINRSLEQADIDIYGTKNTLHRHSGVPAEVKYVWVSATTQLRPYYLTLITLVMWSNTTRSTVIFKKTRSSMKQMGGSISMKMERICASSLTKIIWTSTMKLLGIVSCLVSLTQSIRWEKTVAETKIDGGTHLTILKSDNLFLGGLFCFEFQPERSKIHHCDCKRLILTSDCIVALSA